MWALLASPLFRGLIVALGILAFVAYVRHDARTGAEAVCEAKGLRVELTELKRRVAAAEQVATEYRQISEQQETALSAARDALDAFEEQLQSVDQCVLTDDDVRGLHNIR